MSIDKLARNLRALVTTGAPLREKQKQDSATNRKRHFAYQRIEGTARFGIRGAPFHYVVPNLAKGWALVYFNDSCTAPSFLNFSKPRRCPA